MSQHSNSLVVQSQPQSDPSSLHYHRCWWAWCRYSFYTENDLLDHIIVGHVQTAQPVRLADIHALQLEEESSQEFVFNQLTQGIDDEERSQEPGPNGGYMMDVDSSDIPDARQATIQLKPQPSQSDTQKPSPPPPTPLRIQTCLLPSTLTSSPSYFHSPVYPSAISVTRQSWYQPQRRRSLKKKSASEVSVGHSSPTSSPFSQAVTPVTSPIPTNFLPTAIHAVQSPTSQVFYSASQSQAQSPEESWTQTDSTQLPASYTLLTQAPLHSQSSSQD